MNLLKAPKDVILNIWSVRQSQLPEEERRRLSDVGLTQGAQLFVLNNLNDALIVRTEDRCVALGREYAERIQVITAQA